MNRIFTLLVLCISSMMFAQQDSIVIDEIIITDVRNNRNNQSSVILSDSLVSVNNSTLTDILSQHSTIHFKEAGLGMISTAAFRGTTASQTAVLWNGININSKFLGQTNFSTIASGTFDEIIIKSGGNSILNGSGGIGGSVQLNNKLSFGKGINGDLLFGIGEFSTLKTRMRTNYSTDKQSFSIGYNRIASQNDYQIKKEKYRNINGQFENETMNFSSGFLLNSNNSLSFFFEKHYDDTHFSLISPTATKTKYINENTRSLIKFDNQTSIVHSTIRAAYLIDNWLYYNNIKYQPFSGGKVTTLDLKYDGKIDINYQSQLLAIAEYAYSKADGYKTGIKDGRQNIYAFGLSYNYESDNLYINVGSRKDINQDYKSPYLYSAKAKYKVSKTYEIGLSTSTNFRAPTFNDLYWVPGGNLNLKAEHSREYTIDQKIHLPHFTIGISGYHNMVKDMIRWTPSENGYWSPTNIDEAEIKGIETSIKAHYQLGKNTITFNSVYGYTDSKNKNSGMYFVYVPKHNLNLSLSVNNNKYFGTLYSKTVSSVFTLNDNSQLLDGYTLVNLKTGINHKDYTITLDVKNIFNKIYESVENRPMPQRNFSITINLKF